MTPRPDAATTFPYSKLLLLVRVGDSDCAALATGIALATRGGARLILRVDDDGGRLPPETARAWLDTTLARLRDEGIAVEGAMITATGEARPAAMLADIEQLAPDLVIKESKHESALRRLFITAEDAQLARASSRPLLVVGDDSGALPRRVVAAVDVGAVDDTDSQIEVVVREARRLATATGAELHLAHVFEPILDLPEDSAMQATLTSPVMLEELQATHRERFDALGQRLDVPPERRHLGIGRVDSTLKDLGESLGADVIVTGSHGRSGLERLLSGSTSEALLRHSRQSVLVVKP